MATIRDNGKHLIMPSPKKRPPGKPKPKVLSVQMSTQFKTFLAGASPQECQSILDTVEKIAKGKIKGKRVDWTKLPEDVKRSIEASSRELAGKKPLVA